jgi:acyl-[acyl-carrier-protein]-phospholipid O-acyltransferase/long-chain-fatty-acid--[acyl-carrier-protein] ligase
MSDDAPSQPARQGTILSTGYIGLLLTQFLGAFNDNMFRWLVVPIGQKILPVDNAATLSLVLGGVCFTIPYLLLVATSGSLADRYSKRSVIVGCKVAEIAIMLLGTVAIATLNPWFLFAVVTLMGAQSALFGPAKFGSLPEMLHPDQLSKGNGLLGLVTVVASALGTVAGFRLFGALESRGLLEAGGLSAIWPAAVALIGVAAAGTLTSLWMQRLPAADASAQLKFDPLRETWPALRLLAADRRLMRTALGIGFFWFLASMSQLNIDPFGDEIIGLAKEDWGPGVYWPAGGQGARWNSASFRSERWASLSLR